MSVSAELDLRFNKQMEKVLARLDGPVDDLDELDSIKKIVTLCRDGDGDVVEKFGKMGLKVGFELKDWGRFKEFLSVLEDRAWRCDTIDYHAGSLMLEIEEKYYEKIRSMMDDKELVDAMLSNELTDWTVMPRSKFPEMADGMFSMDAMLPQFIPEKVIAYEWDSMNVEERRGCMHWLGKQFEEYSPARGVITSRLQFNTFADKRKGISRDWFYHAIALFGNPFLYEPEEDKYSSTPEPSKADVLKRCRDYLDTFLTPLIPIETHLISHFIIPLECDLV